MYVRIYIYIPVVHKIVRSVHIMLTDSYLH